jgi:2-aminoadipate transaminase
MKLDERLSEAAFRMKRSIIREMLKLTKSGNIISFSPGLPDPTLFPTRELSEVVGIVLEHEGQVALQYSPTEGVDKLKDALVDHLAKDGVNVTHEELLIITASQQGLDLVSKILVDPDDLVVCELPTYLGGLSAFYAYGAQVTGVELDEEGMKIDILRQKLDRVATPPKFIYVIPDFQNPEGVTMSHLRRKQLLELAEERDLMILEDSPYRSLRYEGENIPSLQSMDRSGRVITIYTFSKILSPGMRLGWAVASPEIISRLVTAKQATDACTPAFTQYVVSEFYRRNLLYKYIERLKTAYKEKMKVTLRALDDFMPEGVRWTKPEGGLFLWITLPGEIDTSSMLKDAIREESVAYTPGKVFFADGGGQNTMRLNFSYPSVSQIREGIERLARIIRKALA